MSEEEIISQLRRELIEQVEEKVKITQWSQLFMSDIVQQLDDHFDQASNDSKD